MGMQETATSNGKGASGATGRPSGSPGSVDAFPGSLVGQPQARPSDTSASSGRAEF